MIDLPVVLRSYDNPLLRYGLGVAGLVGRIRPHTSLPVCVAFGVSTLEQAEEVAAIDA